MDYYNSKDFSSMQEEAVKRVHEMQKRSRSIVNNTPDRPPETSQTPSASKPPGTPPLQGLINGLLNSNGSRELFTISNIKIDEEKALIAMMIYILYKNGADIKLLLGLGYLLI